MTTIKTRFTVQAVDDPLESLNPMSAMAKSMQAHLDVLVLGHSTQLPSPVYMETTAIDY